MRILILGANGILGHTLFLYIKNNFRDVELLGLCGKKLEGTNFKNEHISNLVEIDLLNFESIDNLIRKFNPDFVINCSVKKHLSNSDYKIIDSIYINSILPHKISNLAFINDFKFIHISTDSVFGNFGKNKHEESELIVQDLYSASKALGEPINLSTIVLRTSLIGHSLTGDTGLLDWAMRQNIISGYDNHIFAGLTSLELSKIICLVIFSYKFNSGTYHISGKSISKYELIKLIVQTYNLNVNLIKEKSGTVDRSLSSDKFQNQFNYNPSDWVTLLNELKLFKTQNKVLYG